jgi:exosortase/archaeosortase family protein
LPAGLGLVLIQPPAGSVLVSFTAQLTAAMLDGFGLPVTRTGTTLMHAGGFACEIDLACTALVPAVLLAGVMTAGRARFVALVVGALLMLLVNQLRLVGLVWVGVVAPAHFDLAHGLIGPLLFLITGAGYIVLWRRAPRH